MYINHNSMAGNVANTLTSHYGNLATSTERLSSGLRVNSAADDAAGLAIRELMRADISALQQGVRNANDGISLIQTADGALGVIDEKLIRMKELAEQASTGTYDSTQRLMIESEYQAMASEITRIANATDFNGIKLLDGNLSGTHDGSDLTSTGELKVHFGSGNDSAEDYYYIQIEEMTAQALGVGNASTWQDVTDRASKELKNYLTDEIKASSYSETEKGQLLNEVDAAVDTYVNNVKNAANLANAYQYWGASDSAADDGGFLAAGKTDEASKLLNEYMAVANQDGKAKWDSEVDKLDAALKAIVNDTTGYTGTGTSFADATEAQAMQAKIDAAVQDFQKGVEDLLNELGLGSKLADVNKEFDKANGNYKTFYDGFTNAATQATMQTNEAAYITAVKGVITQADADGALATAIGNFENGLRETEKQKLGYAFSHAAMYNMANQDKVPAQTTIGGAQEDNYPAFGIDGTAFAFGDSLDAANQGAAKAMLNEGLKKAYEKVENMDFAGHTIETQEDAQRALNALSDAIVQKDKTRAHLGALQNRLENTVSNLTVQSENLQAAESRISDVDVATEMTNFVRNQILTQSAVAMLSQANSMPQMAMQLIG